MSAHRKAVPALLAIMALAAPLTDQAQAQSIWVPGSNRASVSLEVLKPIPTRDHNYWTAVTSAFVLSGRIPVAQDLMVAVELPFAHAEMKLDAFGGEGTTTNSSIGNPYLGIQYGSAASTLIADAGVRIPLLRTKDEMFGAIAAEVGAIADLDRFEAYLEDYLSISARVGIQQRTESGFVFRARGGPILWAYTGSSEYPDDEVGLDYSAQAGYEAERFSLLGGLTGRRSLSNEDRDGDISFHHLGMSGSFTVGGVQPGLSLRIPVDEDIRRDLRYVVGVHLTVPIR